MNPYLNEDVMFERLKDVQREMENSRLLAGGMPALRRAARLLAQRVWWQGARLAARLGPRRRPARAGSGEDEAASQAA